MRRRCRGHRGVVGLAQDRARRRSSSPSPARKADGAAFAADAARRGAAAIVAASGAALGAPTAAGHCRRRSAARAGADSRRASIRGSRRRWSPSPAPAARPRSPPSPGRSGSRPGIAAASIGTTGVVAPGRNDYGQLTTPDPVALHELLDRTRRRRRHPCRDGGVEPRPRPAPARRRAGLRPAASPISAATTWTTIRRSRTIIDAKLRLFDTLLPKGAPAVIFADDPVVGADDRGGEGGRARTC